MPVAVALAAFLGTATHTFLGTSPNGQPPPAHAQSLPVVYFESNYRFSEPEPGPATSQVTIALLLSEASTSTVSVEVYTTGISADPGEDYLEIDQVVAFPPGSARQEVQVTLLGNDRVEYLERFRLSMRNPVGARFDHAQESQVTIVDSDQFDAWISYPNSTLEGEDIPITVNFSHQVEYDVTLIVLTLLSASGTPQATDNTDYTSVSRTVELLAGEQSKTAYIPTHSDDQKEGPEFVLVRLLRNACDPNACNLVNEGQDEPVWIADEDVAPGIYLTSRSSNPRKVLEKKVFQVEENNSRSFDIWLSREPTGPVTVTLKQSGDRHLAANPASHTFTPQEWGPAFTVNVEAQADADSYDGVNRLTFKMETDDPFYAGEKLSFVFLTEKDTDQDPSGRRTFDKTEPDVTGGITVSLTHAPWRHNGKNFWVWLTFSEPIKNGHNAVVDALETEGMAVRRAQRVFKDSSRWAVELRPGHRHFLTHLVVRGGRTCGEEHAICARGGKRLANTLTISIAGSDGEAAKLPPGTDPEIPVATLIGDEVSEGDGHGTFTIRLDSPAPPGTTVEFGIFGITAKEGRDFTFTYLPYRVVEIAPGTSEVSVNVSLIDDQVAESAETLGAFLTNPVGVDLDVPGQPRPHDRGDGD